MPHDVAIYTTSSRSAGLYERSRGREGGAERQMTVLARELTLRGHRVAHIIHPPREPVHLTYPLTLVQRDARCAGCGRLEAGAREVLAVWRAVREADAAVVVFRSASLVAGVAAVYSKLRRRAFVFSGSSVSDFTMEKWTNPWKRRLYRLSVRQADAIVVQSQDQRRLALAAFPSVRRVVHIPSFAEAQPPHEHAGPPDAFLWFGRWEALKRPLEYVELARSLPEARFAMILTPTPAHAEGAGAIDEILAAAGEVPNLDLLDPLPHPRLQELIARSVAVVNTSTIEGMPNAFLESWAAGVPVLTLSFDPDGVVAARGLGVAAGGSWDRFVAGARDLWQGRTERDELAERVRTYVEEVHFPAAVAERWSALISGLQREKGGRSAG